MIWCTNIIILYHIVRFGIRAITRTRATHAHTHARAHARARTHTHAHTHTTPVVHAPMGPSGWTGPARLYPARTLRIILHHVASYIALYCIVLHYIALYCIILHYILHYIALYCIAHPFCLCPSPWRISPGQWADKELHYTVCYVYMIWYCMLYIYI
jgi:hypothetical protein